MQLHDVRSADLSHKKKTRVGRGPGSGLGKTAGRGIKGATSRSGYAMKVTYEGGQMPMFRRLPKRGFNNGPFRQSYNVVNVGDLTDFPAGSVIGPDELRDAGLLSGPSKNLAKILGEGELSVALTIKADAFSQSAIAKIKKAGGTIEWIGGAPKKKSPNFKKIAEEQKKAADKAKAETKAAAPKEGAKPEGGKPAKAEGGAKPEAKAPKAPKAEKPAPKAEPKKPEGGEAPAAGENK